jgi:hypothetical protein
MEKRDSVVLREPVIAPVFIGLRELSKEAAWNE